MIPDTLVLKPSLVIHSIYNGYWVLGAPLLRRPLARPTRCQRRDSSRNWDLSAPGLREASEAGYHSRFHGSDKPDEGSPDRR
jgi:hypothetical protein